MRSVKFNRISKLFLFSSTALIANPVYSQTVALPDIIVTAPSPIFARPETPKYSISASFSEGIMPVVDTTFSPVTIIPRLDIEKDRPKNIGDALANKAGISSTSYAPGANRPIIRGLDSVRVRIQENGVGVHDVSDLGEDHHVPVDPMAAEQIEVIRGPATLRYGSQAIGGVVSASNTRIPTFIPINGYQGRITGGFGSVDRARDGAASLDAGANNVAIHLDAFNRKADDYNTPLGRQKNSFFEAKGGAVGASYIFDRGFLGFSFTHYEALYGIPGAESAQSRTRLDLIQNKVQSKGEYRPLAGPIEAIRFWFGGSNYKHDEIGINGGVDGVQATFKNRELEGRVEVQHVPYTTSLGTFRGALGLQLGKRNIGTSGDAGTLLSPSETKTVAVYAFEELELNKGLKLQAAGRIERANVSGTSTLFPSDFLPGLIDPVDSRTRKNFAPKSLSLGVLQTLPLGVVASLTGQYVERAPSAPELYSRGAHDAPGTFEIGDANLKKESARTIEFALRRKEGPFRFDASAYLTRYTGFIYKRLTGERCAEEFISCGVEPDFQQVVYSQKNAKFHGIDLSGQYDAFAISNGFVGVDGQFDFVRAKFDDGTYVPRLPPFRLGGGVFWRNGGGLFARIGLLHAFSHTETAQFETRTPGYNLLKAELSYTHKFDKRTYGINEMTVGVIGDNLLDAKVRNSTSFKKDEVLLQGRTARAFVTARF